MITETKIIETYEATDGPAHVQCTLSLDSESATYRLKLGGFVNIDPNGIKGTDLIAAKDAFEEILLLFLAKYPYTAPPPP